eukprot:Skav225618  [mRNA]  locus=scaffold4894:84488:95085:- [translate_table: standard]
MNSSRSSSPALSEVSFDEKKDFRPRSRGRTPSPCPSEGMQETYHMVFVSWIPGFCRRNEAKGCSLERFAFSVSTACRGPLHLVGNYKIIKTILSLSSRCRANDPKGRNLVKVPMIRC